MHLSSNEHDVKSSFPKVLLGVTAIVAGGLLFWYGWKHKETMTGRLTTAAGLSLLSKALRDPAVVEHLGPLQGLLEGPLAEIQKLLA